MVHRPAGQVSSHLATWPPTFTCLRFHHEPAELWAALRAYWKSKKWRTNLCLLLCAESSWKILENPGKSSRFHFPVSSQSKGRRHIWGLCPTTETQRRPSRDPGPLPPREAKHPPRYSSYSDEKCVWICWWNRQILKRSGFDWTVILQFCRWWKWKVQREKQCCTCRRSSCRLLNVGETNFTQSEFLLTDEIF